MGIEEGDDSPAAYRNLATDPPIQRGSVLTAKLAWSDFRVTTESPTLRWVAVPELVLRNSDWVRPQYYSGLWVIRAPPAPDPIATFQVHDRVDWSIWSQRGAIRVVTNGPPPYTFSFQGRGYELSEGLRTLDSDGVNLARFKPGILPTISATNYQPEQETLVGILATTMVLARFAHFGTRVVPGTDF